MDTTDESRLTDVRSFYELMDALEQNSAGKRVLRDCNVKMDWPRRGIYFFFEPGLREQIYTNYSGIDFRRWIKRASGNLGDDFRVSINLNTNG